MIKVYGIPNCDSVKKARAWFAAHALDVAFHDFKKQGVPTAALERWVDALGWEVVINRKGTTWRGLDEADKAAVVDARSALALAHHKASVIKRPIVEWDTAHGGDITAGFDAEDWARRL